MGNLIAELFLPKVFKELRLKDIKESPGFFIIERSLLSACLPKGALNLAETKAYILQCRRAGGWNKPTFSSSNDILRFGGISKPGVREAAIEGLKDKCFIEELPRENGKRMFHVKGVPLYDHESRTYSPSPYQRGVAQMKSDNNGYIQVPNSLVDEGILRHLSGREARVLLKLYQHNRYEIYGGIDPNIINLVRGGEALDLEDLIAEDLKVSETYLVLDRGLFQDLYLSREEFVTTLKLLARKGLIKVQRRNCSVDPNGRIIIHQGENAQTGGVIHILRPVHQISHQVKMWEDV